MNKYNDLEGSILSCLLRRPELMKEVKLEDKHFKNNYKLWAFMKSFYKKFGCFDITLMMTVAKSKFRLMEYVMYLLELEPAPSRFYEYEKRLIELYEEDEKERFFAKKTFDLANDLFVGIINATTFKEKVDEIFKKIKGD